MFTAFICEYGLYEYTVMPMGLSNATATMQRTMIKALGEYIGSICFVYLDDIIIYSTDPTEHLQHVRMIIKRLQQYNLKVKLEKCKVAQVKIEYLSHVLCNGTIAPSPTKIAELYRHKTPTNTKQVRSFLGLATYYRKFITNFAHIASPLISATSTGKRFAWTDACQIAFTALRELIASEKILTLPQFVQPFQVETDASEYAAGAVLSQKVDGHWKPVAFFSKHFSRIQRSYSATERELLAMVLAIEYFRQFGSSKDQDH